MATETLSCHPAVTTPLSTSKPSLHFSQASLFMDGARALAAMAVVFGHSRPLFLQSLSPTMHPTGWPKLIYILSGWGHQAVIIFFVLSGYLVGGSVIRKMRQGKWSWSEYLIARLTRLYIVLIPALILTFMWDTLSLSGIDASAIPSNDTAVANITLELIRRNSGAVNFIRNLFFLQEIFGPSFGSNTPLWSLSFEFWYYITFPLVWSIVSGSKKGLARIGYAVLVTAISLMVGRKINLYFGIWLLGAVMALPKPMTWLMSPNRNKILRLVFSIFFVLLLFMKNLGWLGSEEFTADLVLALSFGLLFYTWLHANEPAKNTFFSRSLLTLSGFSYTMYLCHFPPLIALRGYLTYETAWYPDQIHCVYLLGIFLLVLLYCYWLSRIFEAHTAKFRRWLTAKLESSEPFQAA